MLPSNLILSIKHLYAPLGLILHHYAVQKESAEYSAASFKLNQHNVLFRQAKITPTKAGLFVTIWKRNSAGITAPYDMQDPIDFFVIGITENDQIGLFIFPKQILNQHGYVSENGVGGKRAIRVYPPWAHNLNSQAAKTQLWQAPFFFEISQHNTATIERLAKMFSIAKQKIRLKEINHENALGSF
jgi:hypothetical protein